MKKNNIVWLCESAVMIALSFVLGMIKLVDLPYGGSVTAGSMVPVAIVAYRYGVARGTATAFVYSILQLLSGLKSFSYATSWQAVVMILLFDYIIAFGVIGLAGVFRKKIADTRLAISLGMALACFARYFCHIISGCTVWRDISIPYDQCIIYSVGYNATYMIPEAIVAVALAWYLARLLDFSKPRIGGYSGNNSKASGIANGIAVLALLAAAVFDAVCVFASTQTEGGFDITAAVNAPFAVMAVVTLSCLIVAAIAVTVGKAVSKKMLKN